MGVRVAIPNFARGCPFTCTFCSQWKFWRDYRVRDPKKVVDEIETLVRDHQVGFFILADEEPTIHRKKFVAFCEELIERNLPVLWGINTRVTDILRDEALLPMFRKAGLIHVSLGTEAAAQLKLDRFNKETTIAQNKKAIQLLRETGIVAEAQFIVGLENETAETLEETYRMALDWKPDMANWAMYTPWPFSDLFQELGDKVEVFDFEKYNFVTPIIKPDAMERAELLDRVMNNYRRFYLRKTLSSSIRGSATRSSARYMLGCLKAFAKSGFQRTFYDLGHVGYWGPQSKKKRRLPLRRARARMAPGTDAVASDDELGDDARAEDRESAAAKGAEAAAMACGGGNEPIADTAAGRRSRSPGPRPHRCRRRASGPMRSRASPDALRRDGRRRAGARSVRFLPARALPPRSARQHGRRGRSDRGCTVRCGRRWACHGRGALPRRGRRHRRLPPRAAHPAPRPRALRLLPAGSAARVLLTAIRGPAWTFAGRAAIAGRGAGIVGRRQSQRRARRAIVATTTAPRSSGCSAASTRSTVPTPAACRLRLPFEIRCRRALCGIDPRARSGPAGVVRSYSMRRAPAAPRRFRHADVRRRLP